MKTLLFFTTLSIIPLVRGFRGGLIQRIFRRSPMPTLSKKCSFDSVCLLSSSSFSSSRARIQSARLFATPQEEEAIKNLLDGVEFDGDTPEVIRLNPNAEDMDDALFESLQDSEPSELLVMKNLLGINIFTYLLGALIVMFLSLNFFLGPGWLGQSLGIQGVGSFNEVSKSLPDTVDLSRPEFRLDL